MWIFVYACIVSCMCETSSARYERKEEEQVEASGKETLLSVRLHLVTWGESHSITPHTPTTLFYTVYGSYTHTWISKHRGYAKYTKTCMFSHINAYIKTQSMHLGNYSATKHVRNIHERRTCLYMHNYRQTHNLGELRWTHSAWRLAQKHFQLHFCYSVSLITPKTAISNEITWNWETFIWVVVVEPVSRNWLFSFSHIVSVLQECWSVRIDDVLSDFFILFTYYLLIYCNLYSSVFKKLRL